MFNYACTYTYLWMFNKVDMSLNKITNQKYIYLQTIFLQKKIIY